MKKFLDLIYSTKATLWFLLIFAIAMASATFIEDKYDTETAYRIVYGAKWFEFVMLMLAINFIGNIKRYDLLTKQKLAGFLFHIAFVIIIIGAGVTRYFGYEGMVHIREGQSSNTLVMPKSVLKVLAIDDSKEYRYNIPVNIKATSAIKFQQSIDTKANKEIEITCKDFFKNASQEIVENVEGGVDLMAINVEIHGQEDAALIPNGEAIDLMGHAVSYNNFNFPDAIKFFERDGKLFINSPTEIRAITFPEMNESVLPKDSAIEVVQQSQYSSENGNFKLVFNGIYKKAKKQFVNGSDQNSGYSALIVNVAYDGKDHEIPVIIGPDGNAEMSDSHIDGITLLMGFGEKEIKLPFSLYLNKFVLERYPGSFSPSSYASEVTLVDSRTNLTQNHRIFMNNVLDYDGYRFFQSSYDQDEKGTILSVNHDFWGTWITYFGYFLMTIGFVLTLINKSSRFLSLARNVGAISKLRKGALMLAALLIGMSAYANTQAAVQKPVSKEHAEKLGQLIVQTYDGRSEPVHTMALDAIHKISKKNDFDIEGKGKMDAMQVFIDIILDADFWKDQKIIYVREKSVTDMLGIEGKYASYNDFVQSKNVGQIKELTENAFRKKQSEQNPFDKDLIKVSERIEVFTMISQGSMLKLFPEQSKDSKTWISWDSPQALSPLSGNVSIINEDLQLPQLNYNNLMGAYLSAAYVARETGDYSKAERVLGYIESIQRQSNVASEIPTQSQVKYEIFYNNANIFILLRNLYGFLAIVLLILSFIDNFKTSRNKLVSLFLNICIAILGAAFLYHTFGMGLRWYLTGHAPWSNGYETLILVAWGGLLSGFIFMRYSKISLAATTLLAFFTLMTASHSSYDPQLTNLQPVLKSYWLIIHVATLTISYGFLGLGLFLGLINLTLMLFKNQNNTAKFSLLIKELSNINEMNLTIGLFLATVGTFLGGVWANESWGRYWGWDAKETWALIITIVYTIVVHLRLVDKLRGDYFFNVGSVLGFGSVLMTFIGVNYYLSKGMHSYGAGDTPIFPIWAWIAILSVISLIVWAGIKERSFRKATEVVGESDDEN